MIKTILLSLAIAALVAEQASAEEMIEFRLPGREGSDWNPLTPRKLLMRIQVPESVADSLRAKRQSYKDLLLDDKCDAGLSEINQFIRENEGTWDAPDASEADKYKMLLVRADRIVALIWLHRHVEALVEGLRAKKIATGYNRAAFERMLKEYPESMIPNEWLQLRRDAKPQEAGPGYTVTLMALQPDNVKGIELEDQQYIDYLQSKVRENYGKILE